MFNTLLDIMLPTKPQPPTIVRVGRDCAQDAIAYAQSNLRWDDDYTCFPNYGYGLDQDIVWVFSFKDRSKAVLFALMFKGK
jgi:hypothetical protein